MNVDKKNIKKVTFVYLIEKKKVIFTYFQIKKQLSYKFPKREH